MSNKFKKREIENNIKHLKKMLTKEEYKLAREESKVELLTGTFVNSFALIPKTWGSFAVPVKEVIEEDYTWKTKFELVELDNTIICTITTPDGFKTQGVAKCCEDDEFDLNIGMTIAQHRAVAKMYLVMVDNLEGVN